jgi:uncharacterized membrane protein YdbT with pleckstrin-like domain
MSYLNKNLLSNEKVLDKAKVHWWIYSKSVFILLAGYIISVYIDPQGPRREVESIKNLVIGISFIFSIISGLKAFLFQYTTELGFTNKRIMAKFGFIRRHTIELMLENVESLSVDQTIIGRLLNFGTIIINGTGGVSTPIPSIKDPLKFRKAFLEQVDSP